MTGWEVATVLIFLTIFGGWNNQSEHLTDETIVCFVSTCNVTARTAGDADLEQTGIKDSLKAGLEIGDIDTELDASKSKNMDTDGNGGY